MTRQAYLELRKALLNEAETLLNEGKMEEYKAKSQEVTNLDDKYEAISKEKANLNALKEPKVITNVLDDVKEIQTRSMNPENVLATDEYRVAFLKRIQGKELTETERKNIASTDVAGAIPTQTSDMIMSKLREVAPLLGEVTLLNIAGNVNFAVEGTNNDAALHTENALITAQEDTLVTVSLGGYEITKLVRISQTVKTMTINAFENWLTDLLAENIGTKIENYLINGTGSSQPEGVDYAQTWADGTNAVDWAAANPTYAEMCELVGYLKGGYYRKAKWLMNHKTFWTRVQAIRDDAKAPIVSKMGDKYMIMGKEVLFSDYVDDDDMFLGAFKKIVANLAQGINVKSSEHSGFAYNAIDYLGAAIFDSQVAIGEAFVKGAATL